MRPHCGNELEAEAGRMLADKAERANVRTRRMERRDMVAMDIVVVDLMSKRSF